MKYYTQVAKLNLTNGNYLMYGGGDIYTIMYKNKNSGYIVQLEGAFRGIHLIFPIQIKNGNINFRIKVKTIFERVHHSCSSKNCPKGMVKNPYTNRLVRKGSKIYQKICHWKQIPLWVKEYIKNKSKRRRKSRCKFKMGTISDIEKRDIPDIKKGDILIMNFGGKVPFTSYKHAGIAIDSPINDENGIWVPLAHCVSNGCTLVALKYIPTNNNPVWVLRYYGPHAEELRNFAGFIARKWASSGNLKFSKSKTLRALLPCFAKRADRETAPRYILSLMSDSHLPKYDNGKYIGMFCSKFAAAVWMATLGSLFVSEKDEIQIASNKDEINWTALDTCLPLKPSNCAPHDLIKLPHITKCWKLVGEFKGWGVVGPLIWHG